MNVAHTLSKGEKIIIQTKTLVQSSTDNSPTHTLSDLATVWAQIRFPEGEEQFEVDKSTVNNRVKFMIRYRNDVTAKNVISYNGDDYDIVSVRPMPRKKFLTLICDRRV